MTDTRMESDSFGPIAVPAQRLWGAQTQRSLIHFAISGEKQPRELLHALALVKRASATVNQCEQLTMRLSGLWSMISKRHRNWRLKIYGLQLAR